MELQPAWRDDFQVAGYNLLHITTGQASQRTLEAGEGDFPGAAPMTVVAQPEQMQVQPAVVVAVQLHGA
jgi:hypothetical protein